MHANNRQQLRNYQFLSSSHLKEKLAKFKKYNAHSAHVTNVRWSHDDSCLVTVGGADLAMMVWNNLDETAPTSGTGQVDAADDDTDSEEESGYDSDVEREKKIDYSSKIYTVSLRESSGTKPQHQTIEESRKYVCIYYVKYLVANDSLPLLYQTYE